MRRARHGERVGPVIILGEIRALGDIDERASSGDVDEGLGKVATGFRAIGALLDAAAGKGRGVLHVRERELRAICLLVDRGREGVALAGAQALEVDGVDDCDLVLGLHHLAALDRGRSGLDARGDLDRLVLVGRVLVRADKGSVNEQLLENYGLRAAELARIEGKGHVLGPVLGLRRELGRGGDLLAVRALQCPSGLCVHEGALEFVFGARDEAGVLDGVDDCGLAVGCDLLISVGAIGCRRLDLGRDDLDGLTLVGQVLMAGDHVAVRLEHLEHDELLVGKGRGVNRERHFHLALGVLGLEGCGRCNGIALGVL